MSVGVVSIPGARRLINSLRDMGYEFESAVADLIDNSIAAKATSVHINLRWDGPDSFVCIADDGLGMSAGELREALRFGSERDYEDDDLGKFGLGLKTASLSQCRELIVASRQNRSKPEVTSYCWDLEHIERTNRWEILPVSVADLPGIASKHLRETNGTVVIWRRLDRILGYKNPEGEAARKRLIEMCGTLEQHLAMVFHRFLEGKVRGKRLSIYLNGNKVVAWDPFVASEAKRKALDPIRVNVEGQGHVLFEPYVLPAQSMFSSPEAHRRASGPNQWNRQQGFYIYRADRLIQSGGWSNIRTLDEHLKLARIAVFFSPKLDEEFKVNVPKMKVAFPIKIRLEVERAVKLWTRVADETYRRASKATSGRPGSTAAGTPAGILSEPSAPRAISKPLGRSQSPAEGGSFGSPASLKSSGHVTLAELKRVSDLLRRVAKPEEIRVIEAALARAQSTLDE